MLLYTTEFYVEVEGKFQSLEHLEYYDTRKACVEHAQKIAKVIGSKFWLQEGRDHRDYITDDVLAAQEVIPELVENRTTVVDYREYDFGED